jgi:hypothetical protein
LFYGSGYKNLVLVFGFAYKNTRSLANTGGPAYKFSGSPGGGGPQMYFGPLIPHRDFAQELIDLENAIDVHLSQNDILIVSDP